jgi:protocatechuate 3,4-dioxygenase alpha subunit
MSRSQSASQTAGPYVHIGCMPSFAGLENMYGGHDLGSEMFSPDTSGTWITVSGCIFDGEGAPVTDAMLEFWQADASGHYAPQGGSEGWGRRGVDAQAAGYSVQTILPAAVGDEAPHINVWVVARGVNLGLHTRIYFDGADNEQDPFLAAIEDPVRRASLIAARDGDDYNFDIHLQGNNETVFLNV